ncbi:MAG: radical SAM protein [Rhodospirillaceae bacterium]
MTDQDRRPRVYFNEYNPFIGNSAYLPLVAGKLHAYALRDEAVAAHYRWMPYLFRIDRPASILDSYDAPALAAFSAAIWNEQLCLHVAAEVKRRWPACLIVFGGSQVPHDPTGFLRNHPFIDVTIRAEGEEPFRAVLRRFIDSRDFSEIERVTWRRPDGTITGNADSGATFDRDIDIYPSPYLDGLYDGLIVAHPDIRFQAIIETNRGCPFHCTFCYWGRGGLSRKYRFFSFERVVGELEWLARNRIAFVYNADSNFGMHRRDEEIAERLVAIKRTHGFPEKIVNLYGKNTDERIFRIAKLLYENGLHKGVGLSRQSLSPAVLENIKRANINLAIYESLQHRFEAEGIPVFCELILALPGETYESFAEGIETVLTASLYGQLIIVLCELYPNTEMAEPGYQRQHGIIGRRNISHGVHSRIYDRDWVPEYIDYVVGTETMPVADWKRSGCLAWTTMTLIGLRLGYDLIRYLRHRYGIRVADFLRFLCEGRTGVAAPLWRAELACYDAFMEQILAGHGRGVVLPEFGEIYWAVEEASFLRLTDHAAAFYDELLDMTRDFLTEAGLTPDPAELAEVITYQSLRIPSPAAAGPGEHGFTYNLPEFFDSLTKDGKPVELCRRSQTITVHPEDYAGDKPRFAREKLLWGRRGGRFEVEFTWYDTAVQPPPWAAGPTP